MVSALFGPAGHSVETIRSGEQGLRAAGKENFDLDDCRRQLTAGTTELFVQALIAACPPVAERLIVADYAAQPARTPRPRGSDLR